MERAELLYRLYKRGLNTPDCVGYHGTSLVTMKVGFDIGFLPGYTSPDAADSPSDLPQFGDIYFMPRRKTFPYDKLPELAVDYRWPRGYTEEDLRSGNRRINRYFARWGNTHLYETMNIAESRGRGHAFLAELDLDIGRHDLRAMDVIESKGKFKRFREMAVDYFCNLGISKYRLKKAALIAKKYEGVELGLRECALDMFPPSVGDGGDDFRLSPGLYGFPIECISGIRALGLMEKEFFEDLRAV